MTAGPPPQPYVSNDMAKKFRDLTERLKEGQLKPHPAADLRALPGLLTSATREMNDEAGALGKRLREVLARKDNAMAKGHAHTDKLVSHIAEVEKFNDEMEAMLGDNGDPTPEAGAASSQG